MKSVKVSEIFCGNNGRFDDRIISDIKDNFFLLFSASNIKVNWASVV